MSETLYKKLNSSFIQLAEYDETYMMLRLVFGSDTVAVFTKVPLRVYEELIIAESHGKYFHKNIKDKYTHVKGNQYWRDRLQLDPQF